LGESVSSKTVGGLGIKEMAYFNIALRLRWPWQKWTEPEKPWAAMPIKLTAEEDALFKLCIAIMVGNGQRTSFWKDRWLNGKAPQENCVGVFQTCLVQEFDNSGCVTD
jgi:hypothetical protein